MTVQELKAKLIDAINNPDTEEAHSDADCALIDFLDAIDPEIGVLFGQVEKWYSWERSNEHQQRDKHL